MFVKEVVKGFTLEVLSSEDDIGDSWTYDIQPKISREGHHCQFVFTL